MKPGNLMLALLLATGAAQMEAQAAKKAVCSECGKVTDVRMTEQDGEGSAAGMIAGGLAGGLLGNQIGSGSGRTVATVAGAAGGAYAGKQVEGKMNKVREWHVTVRFDNGQTDTVLFNTEPALRSGDKVRRRDGTLVRG
jgi:outer membrane lipoprotein SlyB